MTEIKIGSDQRDFVIIRVHSYEHPNASDYWDGNWLQSEAEISAGDFRAKLSGSLRSDEFVPFLEGLKQLYKSFNGVALFKTMEEWLSLKLVGDGKGHLHLTGEALDQPGIGNKLTFDFDLDQTYLPKIILELGDLISKFPIKGKSPA